MNSQSLCALPRNLFFVRLSIEELVCHVPGLLAHLIGSLLPILLRQRELELLLLLPRQVTWPVSSGADGPDEGGEGGGGIKRYVRDTSRQTKAWNLSRNPDKISSKFAEKMQNPTQKMKNRKFNIQSRKNDDDFWLKF